MNRKLGIVVSALMLGLHLGGARAAEPSLEQLAEIQLILSDNDVAALRAYLELNPELLEGDTQLALLLRRFLDEARELTNLLGYAPNLSESYIVEAPSAELPDEGSDPGEEPDGGGGDPDGEPLY